MTTSTTLQEYALAIYSPTHQGISPVVYDLTGNSIDIGSAEDNHIVLNGPGVEAYHLAIRQIGSTLCALVDLNIAKRHKELGWLERRSDDKLYCPVHGQLMPSPEMDICPLCGEQSKLLWLLRPLQSGDAFAIGSAFEATILSQGSPKPTTKGNRAASPSPWPSIQWLERSPNLFGTTENFIVEQQAYPVYDSNLWVWHPKESPIPVFIHQRVNYYTTRHASENRNREVGGLLLGHVYGSSNEAIVYPVVSHAIAARHAAEMRGHLTFTQETWLDLTRQREERFPDKQVVGWYHTHPGLGIFLSEWDLMIHRYFFREPWQVALVIDPHDAKAGIFVWANGDILDPQHPHQLFTTADIEDGIVPEYKPRIRIKLGK